MKCVLFHHHHYHLFISLAVTIPEITPELAEQIVSQAAVQQAAGDHTSTAEGILIQSPAGVLHVPDGGSSQGTGQTGMVIGTEVMVHGTGEGQHTEVRHLLHLKLMLLKLNKKKV